MREASSTGIACSVTVLGLLFLTACTAGGLVPASPTPGAPAPRVIRVAFPSSPDFADLPALLAHELLLEQGYDVQTTFYAQPELAAEALARGDAEFGLGSVRVYWAAIAQGAPIITLMEQVANEWQLVTTLEVVTCADLDGKRLAFHSEGAAGTAMTNAYLEASCPSASPHVLIIPGSENRAAALVAGEIDASPLALADVVLLQRQAPGRFHILASFSTDLPKLKTHAVYANNGFAASFPEVVRDYVQAQLTVHRQISDNPASVSDAAVRWLEADPALIPETIQAYTSINAWDADGGLTAEAVAYSLDFFVRTSGLADSLVPEKLADLGFLHQVLSRMQP